ncbi:MAG TPA: hypothetical protein VN969_07475 [Streptosporangiaceae bacterium]|nr:hypothetical protein [Streptosporangiaceae bacterium]
MVGILETRDQITGFYHRVQEHARHADILREQLDGRTVIAGRDEKPASIEAREAHCAKIE